jgi:hypothetical protein
VESVSLECLLQCTKMWKSQGRGLTGPYAILLVLHLHHDGVCCVGACIVVQLSASVFHCHFWHTSISINELHLPMNIHWLTALCAQNISHSMLTLLSWMWNVVHYFVDCYTLLCWTVRPVVVDCHTLFCWTVTLVVVMQVIAAVSNTLYGIMRL